MNRIFLDSNICIYAFAGVTDYKFHVAFQLLSSNPKPFISSQVLIETYNASFRKLKLSSGICEENTLILCDIAEIVSLNDIVFRIAISFIKKYHFSFLDSCIIATAFYNKCAVLYSEDMQHGQKIEDTLTIVNPFI